MLHDPALRAPIAISLGAITGALCRYYLTLWFTHQFGIRFPYGTCFINLTGCLAMGFFVTLALEKSFPPELRLLIATGFLGAYTTFSTYGLDTLQLVDRAPSTALFYWSGSAILGVLCVQIGVFLAKIYP
jgi:fluoride exporter